MPGYLWPPPPLIADQTHTTSQDGECVLCPRRIVPGDRIAFLADRTGWAHLPCLDAATTP